MKSQYTMISGGTASGVGVSLNFGELSIYKKAETDNSFFLNFPKIYPSPNIILHLKKKKREREKTLKEM